MSTSEWEEGVEKIVVEGVEKIVVEKVEGVVVEGIVVEGVE